jgi:hypothetical protein
VRSTASSIVVAFVAAALWLLGVVEHEYTSVRAPWTGVTYVASACGFVAAGYLGRRWPALLIAAVAAVAASLLVDPLVLHTDPAPPTSDQDCDPGCISTEAAAIMAAIEAALLAALGILLRAAVIRLQRSPSAR